VSLHCVAACGSALRVISSMEKTREAKTGLRGQPWAVFLLGQAIPSATGFVVPAFVWGGAKQQVEAGRKFREVFGWSLTAGVARHQIEHVGDVEE